MTITTSTIAANPRGQLNVVTLLESSMAGSAGCTKLRPGAVPVGPIAGVVVEGVTWPRVIVTTNGSIGRD